MVRVGTGEYLDAGTTSMTGRVVVSYSELLVPAFHEPARFYRVALQSKYVCRFVPTPKN